ncbi:Predicted flavoprotein CzcO associated with the cation diffusion facilitator CzcD [Nocardioides scoriae]|uniref:Predicted flavoprotein CzcO associated with the cation diffusion facilitator CzcD n=1 Tax=Nocardioides scoriae TaxID=642780 RepID=A0A1H1VDA7_9ACTN|nr:NAD(P)/FAD-dependent oxidoreductase [Nocardioides scoriae]SDS82725.1 Predicted flavoprotein CzcO associated with the cation diffusion facilitator CzcD [Nocardioides scoriae]
MTSSSLPGAAAGAGSRALPDHVDVVVIGAGLSGIGAGYRLQTECPERDYLILEGRESMGGTWDLFRYPGVRSDSDIFTFGFTFRPWEGDQALADGPGILQYIKDTAAEFGIDEHVRYSTRVVHASFSTATGRWTLVVETASGRQELTCDFVIGSHGYYSYDAPYDAQLTGIADFAGQVVHPQFWPEDLDVTGKKVVVVGSGATAVTIVPSITGEAAHVTMLQRTPTYIAALPRHDKIAGLAQRWLPEMAAYRVIRAKNIAYQAGTYAFFRRFPDVGKKILSSGVGRYLGAEAAADNFSPPYDPWDQRLCVVPDGDLFKAIKRGDAEVVTDTIDSVVPEGVRLSSGRVLEADVLVTATGLSLDVAGGMEIEVDGAPVDLGSEFMWRGAMVTGVPNYVRVIGYTNASWTLRADITGVLATRVLNLMRERDAAYAVPEPEGELQPRPLLDLASGYIKRSADQLPQQGHRRPWLITQSYPIDRRQTLHGDLTQELRVVPRSELAGARDDAAESVA